MKVSFERQVLDGGRLLSWRGPIPNPNGSRLIKSKKHSSRADGRTRMTA